ncbi:MAG: SEC-C metal-binding domain-containing protein [Eubacteriales bacterium]|nr:SEC-C metal-binding domain-containing protein [Eubacteriales bacterium]
MKAYQLKITIENSYPPIWRRLIVPAGLSFSQFSVVLNQAMGWCGYHMFSFSFPDRKVRIEEEIEEELWSRIEQLNAAETGLEPYLDTEKWFCYEYDFEDEWEHRVEVEKVLTDYPADYPMVLEGEGDCPWEDCGGIGQYYAIRKALENPGHPQYEMLRNWTEESATPPFDLAAVNEELKKLALGKRKSRPMTKNEIYRSLREKQEGFRQIRLAKSGQRRQRGDTLETIFACYQKEDIAEIARNHGLAGFSVLNKERLIQYVRSRVLDPDIMGRYLLYMTEGEIRAFRAAANRGGCVRGVAYQDFEYLGSGGYLGFRNRSEIVIPEEVCEQFRQLDTEEFEEERECTRKKLNYLNAAAGLYGICHVNLALERYAGNEHDTFEEAEVSRMVADMPKSRRNFELDGNFLILRELGEEQAYQFYEEVQGDIAYYMPDGETVRCLGENGFLPFDSAMEELQEFLAGLPGEDDESAFQMCKEIQRHFRFGNGIEEVLEIFQESDIRLEQKLAEPLLERMKAVWGRTRMLAYRGHTPLEMEGSGRELPGERKGSREKIVSFEQRRKTKIYPNDPCPCGSGKKYKNCCGRKNIEI